MNDTYTSTHDQEQAEWYEIRIKGHLDGRWAAWFEGLSIMRADNGETLLGGVVADQAALHGMLRKVRDLGLTLNSVIQIKQPDRAAVDSNTDHNHSQQETNT